MVTIFCSRYFFYSYTIRKPYDVFQISEKNTKRAINPQVIKYKLYTSMHNTLLFCSVGNFSLFLFKVVFFLTSDSRVQFMKTHCDCKLRQRADRQKRGIKFACWAATFTFNEAELHDNSQIKQRFLLCKLGPFSTHCHYR